MAAVIIKIIKINKNKTPTKSQTNNYSYAILFPISDFQSFALSNPFL